MDTIGIRLKRIRERKGLSLRALGKASNTSHSFIADIEAGRSKPSIDTLMALAKALGVSLVELTGDIAVADPPAVYHGEPLAADRADDPMTDLPPEARRSLEEFQEYIRQKYGKKQG
jgi:transcriptional regulator with XRE-family HTH domain